MQWLNGECERLVWNGTEVPTHTLIVTRYEETIFKKRIITT